ncbi:hypothetical protein [Tsukamurella ocularis]|uniref:hypothetical protein n=1 Tax=Tsukamurella ocularis TaxID=1970234 RepID=UPI0021674E6C|nr:hypothetical protein [Tsukamurella ocularis]MCS3780810.1 hypothetical protein [Tsukamurella ocularis]MCS3786634.1 hypothetical protein [Tsukamurella ocularis]MCS3850476.1 hypothetical protein [Tsukamurella ocularis]
MHPNYFEPWHRRHPAAFIILTVTAIVLVILTLGAGLLLGLGVLFVHALSDPVPVDAHDERTVRTRFSSYADDVDASRDVSGMWCTRLKNGAGSTRWFPPGPRSTGDVTVDGDAATIGVHYYPQGAPTDPDEDPVRAKTLVQFRYESGLWRYCGVS